MKPIVPDYAKNLNYTAEQVAIIIEEIKEILKNTNSWDDTFRILRESYQGEEYWVRIAIAEFLRGFQAGIDFMIENMVSGIDEEVNMYG